MKLILVDEQKQIQLNILRKVHHFYLNTYKYNYSLTEQAPKNYYTNYFTVTYNGEESDFYGNPYAIEEEFPADRLALNSNSKIGKIYYNLIRNAGTTGFGVSLLDEPGGTVEQVLYAKIDANEVDGLYYHVNQGKWMNTVTKAYNVNQKVAAYGLEEGDVFRAGYYAVPEYYALLINDAIGYGATNGDSGSLWDTQLLSIYLQGGLPGAALGSGGG